MTVETPERAWTDPRLDDLSKKVDEGFAAADKKMDAGFAALHEKMDAGFAALHEKMDAGFAALHEKMDVGFAAQHEKLDVGFARVDADIRELRGEMKSLRKELLVAAVIIIAAFIGLIPSP